MRKPVKFFVILLVVSASFTIFGQLVMLNDNLKSKLSTIYKMEEKYVFSEQDIPTGKIIIKISNPSQGLYLLQNGEPVSELTDNDFEIDVYDNTVVEIDGRKCSNSCNVNVASVSENIDGFYEKNISIDKNIVILGRFFIK